MLRTLWAAPLAWIYGLVVGIRHKLFDLKILRSEEFDIPIVCVGNLTVGGTGKTPVTEYLIEYFASRYSGTFARIQTQNARVRAFGCSLVVPGDR